MTEKKAAIVTGAATGVGAATALWLAARGYNIAVNYSRSAGPAEQVAADCKKLGVDAFAFKCDVANDKECRALADAAIARWGRIDALVNNAGTTTFVNMDNMEAVNAEDFQRIYGVNVIGTFQMTRAVEKVMRKTGGSVVNVSSVAGKLGGGSSYPYAASKGALNTLTLSMARNLAPEIRVNAVLPGAIEGRWLKEGIGEKDYEMLMAGSRKGSPLGKTCTPEQIADAIGWLIESPGSAIVTGQLVVVDAGMTLGRATHFRK